MRTQQVPTLRASHIRLRGVGPGSLLHLYAPVLPALRCKMVCDPCASRVARTLLVDLGTGEHAHRVPRDLDRHVGLV